MIQLPQQYEWLLKEDSPKMLKEALKIFGTKEDLSVKSNPTILGWAKELGLEGVYNTDSIAWCFGKGTLIETNKGLVPIEDISEGDMVLSHDGGFHRVNRILSREKETIRIKAMGILDTITTEDHPYMVKRKVESRRNRKDSGATLAQPYEWVAIRDIKRGDFIAVPNFSVKPNGLDAQISSYVAHLLGIYIAEGTGRLAKKGDAKNSIKSRSANTAINIGKKDYDYLKKACELAGIKQTTFTERRTCWQIEIRDRWFVELCTKFGRTAIEKKINHEVFGWSAENKKALLDGYLFGDGCVRGEITYACTISKELVLTIAKLARELGINPTFRTEYRNGKTHVIEGRTVNIRDRHNMQWTTAINNKPHYIKDKDITWYPVRDISKTGKIELVYDLEVEDSHSFIANGAIVHNCGLAMAVIAKRAGKEIPQAPLWALNWAKFGTPVSTPMLGDVLVFKRMVGKKTFGHVALLIGEDATCYHTLGGNQSDQVCIVRKAKKSLFVARRPIYSIATPANVRRVFLSSKGALSTKED